MKARSIGIAALLLVGLLQPLGYALQLTSLRGLGMALVASPLPLVFSHFRGLETFSSKFDVHVVTASSREFRQALTPESYALLEGPYQRRNVYGAVVAYGLKLTEPNERELVSSVLKYGFCEGPLLKPFGVTEAITSASVHVFNGVTPIEGSLETRCP